jgi:hypothetical protein
MEGEDSQELDGLADVPVDGGGDNPETRGASHACQANYLSCQAGWRKLSDGQGRTRLYELLARSSSSGTAYPGTEGQRTVSTTDSSSATQE